MRTYFNVNPRRWWLGFWWLVVAAAAGYGLYEVSKDFDPAQWDVDQYTIG